MPIAPAIGTLLWPRKSDIDSPIPVVRSFSTQKIAVISGTFASATRGREASWLGIAAHRLMNVDHALTVRCPALDHNALENHLDPHRIQLRSSWTTT